jgi:serine/threonine-protein kinase
MPPAARDSLAVSSSAGQIPAGATVGARFRIEALVQQDGASQTYRATDLGQGIPAAVRVIPLRALGPAAAQLEADVERASALPHKNLVEMLMVGRESDFYFVATELLDGQTLREFIDGKQREGRGVSFKGACNLVTHIANGLEKAAAFMPHGGLSPANVWVNRAGRVKVADLGLCRTLTVLGRRGAPDGTPDHIYMAPEVVAGGPASPASDVYSLGVILYEVLTGRPPAAPLRPASQIAADAPPSVDAIIQRAVQRAPEARFHSPMELRQALAAALASPEAPGPAPAPGATEGTAATRRAMAPIEVQEQARPPQPQAHPQPHAQAPGSFPHPGAPAPAGPAPAEGGRLTLGRSFNVAEAAGGVADDTQERWLIQKDRLDFGPFSLAQIRAQIERGEIIGEHMIVDSDTGDRKKVKDFLPLREFTKVAERRLEQTRRARAEHQHENIEKRKSFVTAIIVTSLVVVVGGGLTWYIMSRKAAEGGKLASREEEAEVNAFLKGVKLNFEKAHVAKRGGGHKGGTRIADNDADFNNDMTLGDVTKGGGGDETLDDDVIQNVMMGHYRSLVPCIMQEKHKNPGVSDVNIDFVVLGSGSVKAVRVNGQKGAFSSCIHDRMQHFGFPKFNGNKTIASWSMSMR